MSIPLSSLNITADDIENTGIGLLKVMTFGTSGMDCLPYDPSMNDNADLPATMSQEFNSFVKEDADHITVPLARVGKLFDGSQTPTQPSEPTQPSKPDNGETDVSQSTETTQKPADLLGDVNKDGVVNIAYVTAIQRHLAFFELLTVDLNISDYNGDGTLSIKDATAIQKNDCWN